jgi:antitoxin component of MazEF toxin-antitoxin module
MQKKLTKHGNSLALVIEKPGLELLGIDADTSLSVTTDGHCLIIAPIGSKSRRKRFQDALADVNRKYGKALKRLAE